MDGHTDDRQTDGRTDGGNENTPPALGLKGKSVFEKVFCQASAIFHQSVNKTSSRTTALCIAGLSKISK